MNRNKEPWKVVHLKPGSQSRSNWRNIISVHPSHRYDKNIIEADCVEFENGHSECGVEISEENANRIVDCVNNCAGINPGAIPEVLFALKNLVKFFDSSGAQFGAVSKGMWYDSYEPMQAAREALEKADCGENYDSEISEIRKLLGEVKD
jgi:hypothetical protein